MWPELETEGADFRKTVSSFDDDIKRMQRSEAYRVVCSSRTTSMFWLLEEVMVMQLIQKGGGLPDVMGNTRSSFGNVQSSSKYCIAGGI